MQQEVEKEIEVVRANSRATLTRNFSQIDVSYDPSDVSLPMDDGYMPELFEQVHNLLAIRRHTLLSNSSSFFFSSLSRQVDQIRDSINVIQVTVDEIKQTHSKIITAPQQVEGKSARACHEP